MKFVVGHFLIRDYGVADFRKTFRALEKILTFAATLGHDYLKLKDDLRTKFYTAITAITLKHKLHNNSNFMHQNFPAFIFHWNAVHKVVVDVIITKSSGGTATIPTLGLGNFPKSLVNGSNVRPGLEQFPH